MEKHRCKLCFKSFVNGRALGGHMRSHMATLPLPQKNNYHHQEQQQQRQQEQEPEPESASSSSSSSSEEEDKALFYGLRENPRKSFRLVDPVFSFAVDAGSVVQDRESETESSKNNPSRKRSKRNNPSRKSGVIITENQLKWRKPIKTESVLEQEPVSSVSDTTPEEDVALCLMMLSRDIWTRREEKEKEENEEEMDDSDELEFCQTQSRTRAKYQCGTCKKVFKSYQALGGHRASHKKFRGCNPSSSSVRTHEVESKHGNVGNVAVIDRRRIHECPVCFRVFGSGQALGGHKRSHLSGSGSAANSVKFKDNLIDLNLPAPIEDDDVSQVELSAVSDAEFVDPIN